MNRAETEQLRMPKLYMELFMQWLTTSGEPHAVDDPAWSPADSPGSTMRVAQLYAAMLALRPEQLAPLWHLRWASWLRSRFHGPLSIALLSAPNLEAGLESAIRFFPDRLPYLNFDIDVGAAQVNVIVEPHWCPRAIRHEVVEAPLYVLYDYVRSFVTFDSTPMKVALTRPRPASTAAFEETFGGVVAFDAARDGFTLPRRWLAIENPEFDEHAWQAALAQCAARQREQVQESSVSAYLREVVEEAFETATGIAELPSLAAVAAALGLSPRSVIRRLRAEDTSYKQLVDDIRQRRAQALVSHSSIPLGEIGSLLGYQDPANFGRAFRRWFGLSPRTYRQQHAPADADGS